MDTSDITLLHPATANYHLRELAVRTYNRATLVGDTAQLDALIAILTVCGERADLSDTLDPAAHLLTTDVWHMPRGFTNTCVAAVFQAIEFPEVLIDLWEIINTFAPSGTPADTGWINLADSSSFLSLTSPAGSGWSNVGYAWTLNTYQTKVVSVAAGNLTQVLRGTGLSVGVPTDASITGVGVRVYKSSTYKGNDTIAKLVLSNSYSGGDNKAEPTTDWPSIAGAQYVEYGGAGDLWGHTISAAHVNAFDFGFALRAKAGAFGHELYIDHIQMQIFYTA